jgi:hypothetical protein
MKTADSEQDACEKVKAKYLDDFANRKDFHFYLGTHYINHIKKTKNPFIIIGTFHPMDRQQLRLEF